MSREDDLAGTPLFAALPRPVLSSLAASAVARSYRKGAVVFVQGEPGARCYVIVKGSIKVSAYNPDGREAVLAVLASGDVLGELALFDDAPRSADAVVLEDAELLSIDRSSLADAISRHPELAWSLLEVLAYRLRRTNEGLQDAAFFDVPGRVARRLADFAEKHGGAADGGVLLDLPVSQEGLAAMVGATRESVNKAVAGLVRSGLLVRRGRRYLIPDVAQLRSRAR
jgi:CRP-like cAMP-binding protein